MIENQIIVIEADLSRPDHQASTLQLIDAYATEPTGRGKPLSAAAKNDLIPGLRQFPTSMVFLAFEGTVAAGIIVCFRGFSTFAARPLVNIHDVFVLPAFRGKGIAQLLLAAVAQRARAMGCCKLTLEVQENNHRAKAVYFASGFSRVVTGPDTGGALFLSKPL